MSYLGGLWLFQERNPKARTVTNQVDDTIDRINDEGKGIDILVNNVVFSLIGVLEDLSRDEIRAEFETSLFGAIIVMKTVRHIMRRQQGGTTVLILTVHDLTILCTSTFDDPYELNQSLSHHRSTAMMQINLQVPHLQTNELLQCKAIHAFR